MIWCSSGRAQARAKRPRTSQNGGGFFPPTVRRIASPRAVLGAARARQQAPYGGLAADHKPGNLKIDEVRQKAVAEIVDRADPARGQFDPDHSEIQGSGATSLRQIAEALNARGINAPRGGQWHATSVRNVMARA